jgi:pimeloyl-ACP methyl ester carboxylesterase
MDLGARSRKRFPTRLLIPPLACWPGNDILLTNTMLYWATGAINSSFSPYYDRRHRSWPIPAGKRITVPTAYAEFPREMLRPPRSLAERMYNIRRWTRMPGGGHFSALEEPERLAADIRAFFRESR